MADQTALLTPAIHGTWDVQTKCDTAMSHVGLVPNPLPVEIGRSIALGSCRACCPLHLLLLGHEEHCVYDCPAVEDIPSHYFGLCDDSHRVMCLLCGMDSEGCCTLLVAMLDEVMKLEEVDRHMANTR